MLRFSAVALLAALAIPGAKSISDVRYGPDPRQTYDVYAPRHARKAPVLFLVHGGGWRIGDKSNRRFTENKAAHWVPQGYVVISVDYRMLPDTKPLDQARDVARALAAAQRAAEFFGGDRNRFVLMGHSAGAHLVALLASSPTLLADAGATRPIGVVLLDSAALDVPRLMELPHLPLYDRAFGADRAYWIATSPLQQMHAAPPPTLAVCSTQRVISCEQTNAFARKAMSLGGTISVLPENLSHEQINEQLGEAGSYTSAVEAFLKSLR